jgi:hypothetical protein
MFLNVAVLKDVMHVTCLWNDAVPNAVVLCCVVLQFPPMDVPFKEEVKACDESEDPLQLSVPLEDPPSPVMVKRNRSELANTYEWKCQLSEPGFVAAPVSCFSHVSCVSAVLRLTRRSSSLQHSSQILTKLGHVLQPVRNRCVKTSISNSRYCFLNL